jgi:hypothetical protein
VRNKPLDGVVMTRFLHGNNKIALHLCLWGRRFVRITLSAADLLCSLLIARLLLSALSHETLIHRPTGRRRRRSNLTAMLAALILLSL